MVKNRKLPKLLHSPWFSGTLKWTLLFPVSLNLPLIPLSVKVGRVKVIEIEKKETILMSEP